jgi:hypothetical protein
MKLKTHSGKITVNKKSRHTKWLQGRIDSGAWTGAQTIKEAWQAAQPALNLPGASAYVVGFTQGLQEVQK